MKRLSVLCLVAMVVVLLPSIALAGGTGACYSLNNPSSPLIPAGEEGFQALCLNDLTQGECTEVLLGEFSEWAEGVTCDELKVPWDGSCLFDFGGTVGLDCIYLYYDQDPDFAQLICEGKAGGQFFDDPAACGVPTPTLPGFGMAALALLMLGGALILLTMKGSAKTA